MTTKTSLITKPKATKKKSAKKAVKKTTKRTAKKAPKAKSKAATKTPEVSIAVQENELTNEIIAAKAFEIYQDRLATGIDGDSSSDWFQAIENLKQ